MEKVAIPKILFDHISKSNYIASDDIEYHIVNFFERLELKYRSDQEIRKYIEWFKKEYNNIPYNATNQEFLSAAKEIYNVSRNIVFKWLDENDTEKLSAFMLNKIVIRIIMEWSERESKGEDK